MLRESVYESLKRLLMDNALEPGTRLSIDGLARELQVSQTPVREALFRCEAEGLVVRRPNAGYVVAPLLGRDALLDLYDLRLLLEPTAAARAAANATERDRQDIDDAVRAMAPAVDGDSYGPTASSPRRTRNCTARSRTPAAIRSSPRPWTGCARTSTRTGSTSVTASPR